MKTVRPQLRAMYTMHDLEQLAVDRVLRAQLFVQLWWMLPLRSLQDLDVILRLRLGWLR